MSLLINRAAGDTTPIKIKWSGDVDFAGVTAIAMKVYDSKSKDTLVETLDGEVRGFDPYTYFPVSEALWTGRRYFQLELTVGGQTKPLPGLGQWQNA